MNHTRRPRLSKPAVTPLSPLLYTEGAISVPLHILSRYLLEEGTVALYMSFNTAP